MGVNLYLLDRRKVHLTIAGHKYTVGSLRRFWKVTEIDEARASEIASAKAQLGDREAPAAVLITDISELPLAASPGRDVRCHAVLGWDIDRYLVTDFEWDFLPVLGYAVMEDAGKRYVLYENKDGQLYPIANDTAVDKQIIDESGHLLRRGQPRIQRCNEIQPFINRYAKAKCLLEDGRSVELLTTLNGELLPGQQWYAGKRPVDVEHFP